MRAVYLICACALVAACEAAGADPRAALPYEQARGIYAVAWGQTHALHQGDRALLERMPAALKVERAQLCALYPGARTDCAMQELYLDGVVYLSEEVDVGTVKGAALLAHSYVHHIQERVAGGKARDCAEALAREREAHRIHAHILMQSRHDNDARQVAMAGHALRCPAVDTTGMSARE